MAQWSFIVLAFLIFGYFVLFTITFIYEKEKRPALLFLLLSSSFLLTTVLLILFVSISAIFLALTISLIVLFMILFLPYGKNTPVQIIGSKTRYDERDSMFARTNYRPGSLPYQDYYERHPEKKEGDDTIRAMPELMTPGGEYYEPNSAKITKANFELTEQLIPFCDGQSAPQRADVDFKKISLELKKMAFSSGAADVRIAALDQQHFYSHIGRRMNEWGTSINPVHTHALVFAVEMDFATMQAAPRMSVVLESSEQYLKAAVIGIVIAAFIRSQGYRARAHTDGNYLLPLPAVASDAGLGEVGRLGYLIHPKYGARIRLGAVTTDMPLVVDASKTIGVQNFCRICVKCAAYCPAGAISFGEEKEVRGVRKWSTNQEACYKYWRAVGTDCGICMRVCPYSKPNNFVHNVIRLMIRQNPVARRLAVWGDRLLYNDH